MSFTGYVYEKALAEGSPAVWAAVMGGRVLNAPNRTHEEIMAGLDVSKNGFDNWLAEMPRLVERLKPEELHTAERQVVEYMNDLGFAFIGSECSPDGRFTYMGFDRKKPISKDLHERSRILSRTVERRLEKLTRVYNNVHFAWSNLDKGPDVKVTFI